MFASPGTPLRGFSRRRDGDCELTTHKDELGYFLGIRTARIPVYSFPN
jgi:hypothetical protein